MRYQIVCVNKPDRNSSHERITAVGTNIETLPIDDVIYYIEKGIHSFYTLIGSKEADVVVVREANKRPFLRTVSDGYYSDNLLALPACSLPIKK